MFQMNAWANALQALDKDLCKRGWACCLMSLDNDSLEIIEHKVKLLSDMGLGDTSNECVWQLPMPSAHYIGTMRLEYSFHARPVNLSEEQLITG